MLVFFWVKHSIVVASWVSATEPPDILLWTTIYANLIITHPDLHEIIEICPRIKGKLESAGESVSPVEPWSALWQVSHRRSATVRIAQPMHFPLGRKISCKGLGGRPDLIDWPPSTAADLESPPVQHHLHRAWELLPAASRKRPG